MTQQSQRSAEPSEAAEQVTPRTMRKVASVSLIGNMIEYYDFFIYATAAALVFPRLFFPALGDAAGVVASFATLGVAFVARPIGSIVFGHVGDRLGRKTTLVVTLLLMGIATLLVGVMPTAAQIGVLAPIAIVFLRLLQGLAAGGEWAGAVLYAAEYAPPNRRGFWSSFPAVGSGFSLALGNLAFVLVGLSMDADAFLSYGWRIPFLFSAVLIAVGLYIRLRTAETPVFKRQVQHGGTAKLPLADVFRTQPLAVLLGAGAVITVFVLYFVGSTLLVSYGTTTLRHDRNSVLAIVMLGGLAYSAGALVVGGLSDRLGRRTTLIGCAVLGVVWSLVLFPLVNTGSLTAFAIGAIVCLLIAGMGNGPLGAFFSELYETRYRYTAAALSYNIGGVLGGGIPPLIIASLIASSGPGAVTWLLAALGVVSLLCWIALSESRTRRLEAESVTARS